MSLRDARLDSVLTIAREVDLSTCVFDGAQNLDRLSLASTDSLVRVGGRRVLQEEILLRGAVEKAGSRILLRRWPRPKLPADVEPPAAANLALFYRAMRKGLEDNKDSPGAADFYFGEMEIAAAKYATADRLCS